MGWSVDWMVPRARLEAAEVEALVRPGLERLADASCRIFSGPGGSMEVSVDFRGPDGREYGGCFELWFDQPDDGALTHLPEQELRDRFEEPFLEDERESDWIGAFCACAPWEEADPTRIRIASQLPIVVDVDLVTRRPSVSRLCADEELAELRQTYMTGLRRDIGGWWVSGWDGTVFRQRDDRWERFAAGALGRVEIHDVCALASDDVLVLTGNGTALRVRDGRVEPLPGLRRPSCEYIEVEEGRFRLQPRGDDVWFTNGSDRLHRFAGGSVEAVELPGTEDGETFHHLAAGPDGALWVASAVRLLRGDGARWDVVWDLSDEDAGATIDAMCAGRAGEVWAVSRKRRLLRFTGRGFEPVELGFEPDVIYPPCSLPGGRVGVAAVQFGPSRHEEIAIVRPAGPPRTRITVRSNRGDNREERCWEALCELALGVVRALDGELDQRL